MPQEIRGHLHRPRQKVYPEFPSQDGNITTNHQLKPHVNSASFAEDWDVMQHPKHKSLDWFKGKSTGNHGFYH